MMIDVLLFIIFLVLLFGVTLIYVRLCEIRDSIQEGTKEIENEIFQIRIQLLNNIKDNN